MIMEVESSKDEKYARFMEIQNNPKWYIFVTSGRLVIFIFLSVLSASLCLLSFHLMLLMAQWMYEARHFRNLREINSAVLVYYQEQFYTWYMYLRNWSCHKDGKIQVILPNYLAS
ncbi:uncharacterized protein LOC144428166 [Styela clava]